MALGRQDTIAARSAISRGDLNTLERYLREGSAGADTLSITAATTTLNFGAHGGKTLVLNLAGGMTITLPSATGSQDSYYMVVGTTFTSSGIIKVGRAADTMIGMSTGSTLAGTGSFVDAVGGTDDTITMGGSTTGGLVGSTIRLTDIAANLWLVDARIIGSGTMATSFSATV